MSPTHHKKKVYNFAPGPAKLPDSVVEKIQLELHNHQDTGLSILELSHRSKEFSEVLHKLDKNLKTLLPDSTNYSTLLLQGGGTGQFAAVPLNLMNLSKAERPCADYVITGTWSSKGAKEAEKYLTVNKCITPPLKEYTKIPDQTHWVRNPEAAYMYYCSNETIHGVEFDFVPDSKGIPLVADMSSNFLTRPVSVGKHGVIFAGTQKNLGSAGLTMVMVRSDLIGHATKICPSILDYKIQHDNQSIYNTAPVFNIYVTNLVLEWIRDIGGLEELERRNILKSKLIYDVIDDSKGFYHCPVELACRSRVNIPFRIGSAEGNESVEKTFLKESLDRGMISLKGHRSIGGIRVSLFNAVTVEETETLADFMKEFYEKHGAEEH